MTQQSVNEQVIGVADKLKEIEVQASIVGKVKKNGEDPTKAVEELKKLKIELNELKEKLTQTKKSMQLITPLEVHGREVDKVISPIDYSEVKFEGSCIIDDVLKDKLKCAFEKNNKTLPAVFDRDLILGHRDLGEIVEAMENKKDSVYILSSLHPGEITLGHIVPLQISLQFQECFQVPVVIQISDNQKFYTENIAYDKLKAFYHDAVAHVMAMGFDTKLTYIYSNIAHSQFMYPNLLKLQKTISVAEVVEMFSLTLSDIAGLVTYPSYPICGTLSSSCPAFDGESRRCLSIYPCEQDPYFALARRCAKTLGELIPATLSIKVFGGLQSVGKPMTFEPLPQYAILMKDTPKQIQKKINTSFSGGKDTMEEQRELGANLDIDVPYHIFRFLATSSEILLEVGEKYSSGAMLTGEMKKLTIDVIKSVVAAHQEKYKQFSKSISILKKDGVVLSDY